MKPQHQTMGVPSPLPRNASLGTSYSCPQLEAQPTNLQLEAHTTNPQLEAHTTNPEILYERLDKIINPLPRNASLGTSYNCPQLEAHTTNPQLEAHTTNPEILYERLDKIVNN